MNDKKKPVRIGDRFQDKDERGGVRVVYVEAVDDPSPQWPQGFRARVVNEETRKSTRVRVDALQSRWRCL